MEEILKQASTQWHGGVGLFMELLYKSNRDTTMSTPTDQRQQLTTDMDTDMDTDH